MKYIGIDLGTTNSAICSYDGENLKLYKSPEQHDVTPSAIFIDKRGNKHVGLRAYNNSAHDPENAATLFKRFMGTSTPIKLAAANMNMTPQECSSEILKTLFGYLPEEMRNDPDTGTVITVPAAFNQMQKDATQAAADLAGLGKVALMQEPVAAVMSVMRHRKGDGIFIVYDLGGGTLDVAIAESISGRVSLLSHGGVAMCGGRDFDRHIFDNVVKPWLLKNFDLPDDLSSNAQYQSLKRKATWAAEKAKIELSQKDSAKISLSEMELATKDSSGKEMYLDIEFDRPTFEALISSLIDDSINAVRETMEKSNLSAHDIERIVFVGGPTHYKPLRDKVAFQLGIAASTDVNPMTAVAEGAAIFAESIDWSSQSRGRKNTRGSLSADGKLDISFNFVARTPDSKAKIVAKLSGSVLQGSEFQIDSLDTGWSSGKISLKDGASVDVSLPKPGDNHFKVFVFDAAGGPLNLEDNRIVITRTAASIDAIPASSSIGIEILDKIGGRPMLEYLVKKGEPLPKKNKIAFKATESLRPNATNKIRFKIWEGEIKDIPNDNRYVGEFSITGEDFDDGVITAGSDLICEYDILDSGNIVLKVSVPSIGASFDARNFYSRQSGEIDYTQASKQISHEAEKLKERLNDYAEKISDPKIEEAFEKLEHASNISEDESDPETSKRAMDNVHDAKKLLAEIRQLNLKEIRQIDLDACVKHFEPLRELARPTEVSSFDTLAKSAQRSIDNNGTDFESLLSQLKGKVWGVLARQDWFIVDRFKWLAGNVHVFPDKNEHAELVNLGKAAIQANDIDKLRQCVGLMDCLRIDSGSENEMLAAANIVRG